MAGDPKSTRGEWMPPSFDDFTVIGPLGRGGMGHVYLARDTALDRPVALKVIASSNPSEVMRRRFVIEARAIARIAHPNVVGVYRIGEVGGRPYVAYELVTGHSLDRIAKPIGWAEALRIGLGMARGLSAAHRGGVLHRDIKPGNVMLSASGDVKILDFGLAKLDAEGSPAAADPAAPAGADPAAHPDPGVSGGRLIGQASTLEADAISRAGVLMGTPLYIAPEQWRGEPATVQSDVYALGLVLHELLAGDLPHASLAGEVLMLAVTTQDLPPIRMRCADVPESLAQIIDRCVRREPAERFASAEEVRVALEDLSTVFLAGPAGRGAPRIEGDARVVAMSFGRVLPRLDAFTHRLYSELFAARPELRGLFAEDMAEQRSKLAHMLRLSVEGLREPERLVPVLEDLGRRHATYGVSAGHFGALGDALFRILPEYDTGSFGEEEAAAWRRAFDFIAAAMVRGIDQARGAPTRASGDLPGGADTVESARDAAAPPLPENAGRPTPGSAHPPATPASERDRTRPSARESDRIRPSARESGPIPRTQYALVREDASVAYQVFGQGPIDVVLTMRSLSHVEMMWEHPGLGDFLRRLAERARVIVFDARGTGLSDRMPESPRFEDRLDDLRAVLDATAAGAPRTLVLFGVSEGAWTCLSFAARHPERVHGLVLFSCRARLTATPDHPYGPGPAAIEAAVDAIRRVWGEPLLVDEEVPSLAGDPQFRDWYGRYLRMSASPGNAITVLRINAQVDVRPILPEIRARTIVLHRSGDRLAPPASGKLVADAIAGARFVELPGADRVPFAGDVEAVHAELERFFAEVTGSPAARAGGS